MGPVAALGPGWRRLVEEAPVARLATVRPDGRPHVVPITFALYGDTIVTAVDHKPKTTTSLQRLRNLAAHPVASVVVDRYHDDWSALWWVRADGPTTIVEDGPAYDRAVALLAAKYVQYRERPPTGPVVSVAVERWATWSPRHRETPR